MERDQFATHMERNVMLARPEVGGLDEALSWVVQQVDTTFRGARMVRITVEQVGRSFGGELDWQEVWQASIGGMWEEEVERRG